MLEAILIILFLIICHQWEQLNMLEGTIEELTNQPEDLPAESTASEPVTPRMYGTSYSAQR